MLSSKKLTCTKGLCGKCLSGYRLEIPSVTLVFSTQLWELLPLSPSGSTLPPPPLPCVNKYTVYTYTVCSGEGGLWCSGTQTDKQLPQSPLYRSIFLDDDILYCLLWVLPFYGWQKRMVDRCSICTLQTSYCIWICACYFYCCDYPPPVQCSTVESYCKVPLLLRGAWGPLLINESITVLCSEKRGYESLLLLQGVCLLIILDEQTNG
jgi:hypothetical protein